MKGPDPGSLKVGSQLGPTPGSKAGSHTPDLEKSMARLSLGLDPFPDKPRKPSLCKVGPEAEQSSAGMSHLYLLQLCWR
jgi:hypothetical protein